MKILQRLYYKIKSFLNKNMTILCVDVANKSTMTYKNGSMIECQPIKDNKDNAIIRGKRSKLPIYYDNFNFDQKEFDEVIKNYTTKGGL